MRASFSSRLFISLLSLSFLVLAGCQTQEVTKNFDIVFGPGYTPTLHLYSSYLPQRVLLLPMSGFASEADRLTFLNEFMRQWNSHHVGPDIVDSGVSSQPDQVSWSDDQSLAIAKQKGCDAYLSINLENAATYEPLRITFRVTLERVDNKAPLLDGELDYDARNRDVANSARRFYQHDQRISNTDPDRSMNILSNRNYYIQFVAAHSASVIKKYFQDQ